MTDAQGRVLPPEPQAGLAEAGLVGPGDALAASVSSDVWRGARNAKWNELLRIEEGPGATTRFAPRGAPLAAGVAR